MADTYNPNEIVRCKHLSEFARQLNIKLDGGTDPKPQRSITKLVYLAKNGETQTINMSNPVINCTRDTAFYSSNTQNTIIFRVSTNYGGSVPEIRDLQTTGDGEWQLISASYGFPSNPTSSTRNLWNITIKREGFSAETVTFTLHFDETPTYAAFDLPITFNFTES